jgi:hypothetical protein
MPPVRLEAKIWASLNDDSGAVGIAGTVKPARETTSLFDIVDRRAIRAVAAPHGAYGLGGVLRTLPASDPVVHVRCRMDCRVEPGNDEAQKSAHSRASGNPEFSRCVPAFAGRAEW